jgi:histidyl-tRNA synthetase
MPRNLNLSTDPYKGVRDFYPADMRLENRLLGTMRQVIELFGYEEYGASVLEPAELYRAKSGEELVSEQTYTFTDRGGREVTLRPEMTPTVARMIAGKRKELVFPIRWYSIPNLFRYEQPQKGRLREHWQLNVDIFGVKSVQAEIEIISIASAIMRKFGLKDTDFEIRINHRKILDYILRDVFMLEDIEVKAISRLIDKKEKVSADMFKKSAREIVGGRTDEFLTMLNTKHFDDFINIIGSGEKVKGPVAEVKTVIDKLEQLGIANVVFSQTVTRGFDYYTGIVFEIFDTNPENRRSIFGGGRYDDLLDIFGAEKLPAVGFGMGDVVVRDVLGSRNILPTDTPAAGLYICPISEDYVDFANELGQSLREQGLASAIDYSGKKVGDQIKYADKHNFKYVICIGEDEKKSGQFKLKELSSGKETIVTGENILKLIRS